MRYFYIFPFKRQYYFPREIGNYPFLKSLFKPYSRLGVLFWWIWNNIPFFKYLFTIRGKNISKAISVLIESIGNNIVLAVNTGTIGYTQKITALGYDKNNSKKFFVKFSFSDIAKKLTKHEGNVLQQIQHYGRSARVLDFKIQKEHVILITEYIEGEKLESQNIDEELFELILEISQIKCDLNFLDVNSNFINCFAHGDFCPWNLLRVQRGILPVDWEFSQNYPLGFDLFTYIFQTSFLLQPNKNCQEIINDNRLYIERYFKEWHVENWRIYLLEFTQLKLKRGDVKSNSRLHHFLNKLKDYAEQA